LRLSADIPAIAIQDDALRLLPFEEVVDIIRPARRVGLQVRGRDLEHRLLCALR